MTERFWQIIERIEFPLLVTNGEDGFPQARPMSVLSREGGRLWFATSPSSGKVKQITADPRVTVLFADTARFNYASLHDRAQVATDEEKTSLWWDARVHDWPDAPSDPDYVLIKVRGNPARTLP